MSELQPQHRGPASADEAVLRAVCLALSGEDPGAVSGVPGDAEQVSAVLAGRGWAAERLAERRRECQRDERPWPVTPPREWLVTAGFARYGALLKQCRALLGLDGLVPAVHRGPVVIGPAEQRLLAERPPHHVG